MKLKKIERLGEITQVRVMMPEKLATKVQQYLMYYSHIYGTEIDLREFGLLAFEAILTGDQQFAKWVKEELTVAKPTKPKRTAAVNGQDTAEGRE